MKNSMRHFNPKYIHSSPVNLPLLPLKQLRSLAADYPTKRGAVIKKTISFSAL